MSTSQIRALTVIAVILIFGGVLSFFYGGYMYANENFDAMEVVPIDVKLGERGGSIPIWGGVASIALGIVLIVAPRHTQLTKWAIGPN